MTVTDRVQTLAYHAGALLLLLLVSTGCHGGGPVTPETNRPALSGSSPSADTNGAPDGRVSWGLWSISVDPVAGTSEVIPLREGDYHYNVLHMLEGWACKDCVSVAKLDWEDKHTMLLDISIKHPYPLTRLDLTGRDVRGIAIFDGTTSFPYHTIKDASGVNTPVLASRVLLNPDGYSQFFNRWTSHEGKGTFDYQRGRFAPPGEIGIKGNLHPFKYFWTHDYLRLFYPGYTVTRTYRLAIDRFKPFTFAYSVDASWTMPYHWPVINPVTDFPISAGAREAYQISTTFENNTLTRQGGQADLVFDIFDHQSYPSISAITIEAPDLFKGTISVDPTAWTQTGMDSARYDVILPNIDGQAKTAGGGSDILIVVEDVDQSVVGEDVRAYAVTTIPVEDTAGQWRPRGGTFQDIPFPGPVPQGTKLDMSVITNPQSPWAITPGESMLLFQNDQQEQYLAYNREFTNFVWLAGYPGSSPSFLKPVERLDAATNGAFGVVSSSTKVVNSPYEIRDCTNVHQPGGIYSYSWYTGSEDDTIPHLELAGDVSGGFGGAAGDPIYSLYNYDPLSGSQPPYESLHRIQSPYNDPGGVLRAFLPLTMDLTGTIPPLVYGVSYKYFVAMGIDDHPVTDANPYGVNVYTVENRHSGLYFNAGEMDIWDVNFADPLGFTRLRTYNSTLLGKTQTSPSSPDDPRIVDVATLPAWVNNAYIGNGAYATNNWVAVLYQFDNWKDWFIEIYDARLNDLADPAWKVPIYSIGPYAGNARAMDVDTKMFEIYVLHDDNPSGVPDMRLSCFEFV